MFIEHINQNIIFHDNDMKYGFNDLIKFVVRAQSKIEKLLNKPSVIGFCSNSSFFELASILAFLELGHKILFIPKKHVFYYDIHGDFYDALDLIVDLTDSNINPGNILLINKNDLFNDESRNVIKIEKDDLKTGFMFLSSGTTGKPKVIEQTHRRLIHAARQTIDKIWAGNKNFLLHRGNTINHLGIFTTTYLPALFIGENVSWCNHIEVNGEVVTINSDETPIYNSMLLFPYQPIEILNNCPLAQYTKIITGGSSIGDEFIDGVFKHKTIDSIYNVYGATEIITPLMWVKIDRNTESRTFNVILDGLKLRINSNMQIDSVYGFVDTDKPIEIPDTIKMVSENEFQFIGRKNSDIFRQIKRIDNSNIKTGVHNISLTEDELIQILTEKMGKLDPPVPIIIKTQTEIKNNNDYYLIFDPKIHKTISNHTLDEINEVFYLYYGISKEQLESPLITDIIPFDNLSDFNNGLKLDRGAIKKIISNKINKKQTTLL